MKTTTHHGGGVEQFLAEHGGDVTGVISGFDRLRLARRWRRATSARLGRTVKLPPLSPKIGYTQGIGPSLARSRRRNRWPHPSRRRGPATGRLLASASRPEPPTPPLGSKHNRICGADLPSSLETGLFNRRPAPRYGEEERSELGSFFI